MSPELIGTIVGGSIAIVGIAISQLCGFWKSAIEHKKSENLRQRQRLEKIVDHLGESLTWFPRIGGCRSIEDISSNHPPAEARQVAMLARLYFPSLVEPAIAYANSLLDYYHFALDCFHPDVPASAGAQIAMAVTDNPELQKRNQHSLEARTKLEDLIDAEAEKLAKA